MEGEEPPEPYVEGATRVRFGIGYEVGGGSAHDDLLITAGMTLRAGVQLNDYLALLVQPHVVYWNVYGVGGVAAGGHGLVELTLFDRLFLGGGLGYNQVFGGSGKWVDTARKHSGPGLLVRLGGYWGVWRVGTHRLGLQTGVDVHAYFGEDGETGTAFGTLGFELF